MNARVINYPKCIKDFQEMINSHIRSEEEYIKRDVVREYLNDIKEFYVLQEENIKELELSELDVNKEQDAFINKIINEKLCFQSKLDKIEEVVNFDIVGLEYWAGLITNEYIYKNIRDLIDVHIAIKSILKGK